MLPIRSLAAALRHGGSCSTAAAASAAAALLPRRGGGGGGTRQFQFRFLEKHSQRQRQQYQRRLLSATTTTTSQSASAAQASQSASAASKGESQEAGLSTLGTLFFGGLCLATLGLGCWQSARYFEKVEQMAVREEELRAEPVELRRYTVATPASAAAAGTAVADDNTSNSQPSFRRLVTRGTFDHTREMLVGPRGPPPGALSSTGPSSGRSGGGMSSSPQGYYVVTPLRIAGNGGNGNGDSGGEQERTILVNRGWVPMSYVKQQAQPQSQPQQGQQKNGRGAPAPTPTPTLTWSRPKGIVEVVGVETSTETPKFLSPVHDARTPNRLLWMDRAALEQRTGLNGSGGGGQSPLLLTETTAVGAAENGGGAAAATATAGCLPASSFPVKPTAETVGEFKVTPTTHAGYAVTWFGLSGAGMVMTRKLLTRGR